MAVLVMCEMQVLHDTILTSSVHTVPKSINSVRTLLRSTYQWQQQ